MFIYHPVFSTLWITGGMAMRFVWANIISKVGRFLGVFSMKEQNSHIYDTLISLIFIIIQNRNYGTKWREVTIFRFATLIISSGMETLSGRCEFGIFCGNIGMCLMTWQGHLKSCSSKMQPLSVQTEDRLCMLKRLGKNMTGQQQTCMLGEVIYFPL